jgi:hypothetical protein
MEVPIYLPIDTTENWNRGAAILGASELAIEVATRPDGTKTKHLLVGNGERTGPNVARLRATPEFIAALPSRIAAAADGEAQARQAAINDEARARETADQNLQAQIKLLTAVEGGELDEIIEVLSGMAPTHNPTFTGEVRVQEKTGSAKNDGTLAATEAQVYRANEFTFVIDSDAALAAWADNAPGNDYARVLIKSGTWALTREIGALHGESVDLDDANTPAFIDLSDGRTRKVTGEQGARVALTATMRTERYGVIGVRGGVTGTVGAAPIDDSPALAMMGDPLGLRIESVDIKLSIQSTVPFVYGRSAAFYRCGNLEGCKASINRSISNSSSTCQNYVYMRCIRLTDCHTVLLNSYAKAFAYCVQLLDCTSEPAEGIDSQYGFYRCYHLARCRSKAIHTGTLRLFEQCHHLVDCVATGEHNGTSPTTIPSGFYNCSKLNSCHAVIVSRIAGSPKCFLSCDTLTACTALAVSFNTNGISDYMRASGFESCSFLDRCRGTGISSREGFGFIYCHTGFGCKSGDQRSATGTFVHCYMPQGGDTAEWANTAAGGYNLP